MNRVTNTTARPKDILIADSDAEDDFESALSSDDNDEHDVRMSMDSDEFDEQVQHAQEQLLALRHQQEIIERQKAEIEELKNKRQLFLHGRTEVVDKLNRSIITLERETYEAQKRVEHYLQVKESFERHLENIEDINPDEWSRSELRNQIGRALGIIEDARTDYQKSIARVETLFQDEQSAPALANDDEDDDSESNIIASAVGAVKQSAHRKGDASSLPQTRDFGYWFRTGFAFTLPLIIFGVFALIIHILLG